jgi:hypothetical protein
LCDNDPNKISESALIAKEALEARIALWNGIENEIKNK